MHNNLFTHMKFKHLYIKFQKKMKNEKKLANKYVMNL
jgi:hypothetical protein